MQSNQHTLYDIHAVVVTVARCCQDASARDRHYCGYGNRFRPSWSRSL